MTPEDADVILSGSVDGKPTFVFVAPFSHVLGIGGPEAQNEEFEAGYGEVYVELGRFAREALQGNERYLGLLRQEFYRDSDNHGDLLQAIRDSFEDKDYATVNRHVIAIRTARARVETWR